MKKILTSLALSSAAAAIIGVVLLIWPSVSNTVICYVIAVAFIAYGIFRTACYFTRGSVETMLARDLAAGLISVAVGVFCLLKPSVVISILPVLFGLALIAGAMGAVQTAFDLRRMEDGHWALSLIAALVFLILGILILVDPFSSAMVLTRFIGAALIIEGVCGLISAVKTAKLRDEYFAESSK
jgi:uncharacterized membrane protein HdeD (DUF308 family)